MLTARRLRTKISRDDMAVIFELVEMRKSMTEIAHAVGYDRQTIERGIVIAKLIGFEGCTN